MFTTVKEERFRKIAHLLVQENVAPPWFASVEYVVWEGKTKDLSFVLGAEIQEVLLVDDFEFYIHPSQESQWVKVDYFDYPYDESDRGLVKVIEALEQRLAQA